MATILDSNVVLDVVGEKQEWKAWSMKWVDQCREGGELILNAITFAEVASEFANLRASLGLIETVGLTHEDIPLESAYRAGRAHQSYRLSGGKRERVLPDFLIGAHAEVKGYRILTRDAARYRTYFPGVEVISPDTHP